MAIRLLSSENITGNITLHHPSNAPYIDFVENADTGDYKERIKPEECLKKYNKLIKKYSYLNSPKGKKTKRKLK